jgi:hypothetical protein
MTSKEFVEAVGKGEFHKEEMWSKFFGDFKLNQQVFANAWCSSCPDELLEHAVCANATSMTVLNDHIPGATHFLWKYFGIKNFGRYPIEALVEQTVKSADTKSPYGVAFFPRYDWSGNFYGRSDVYEGLLRDLNPDYRLRIFEVSSTYQVLSSTRKCMERWGERGNKISFAIFAGHANKYSFVFNHKNSRIRPEINIKDLRYPNYYGLIGI